MRWRRLLATALDDLSVLGRGQRALRATALAAALVAGLCGAVAGSPAPTALLVLLAAAIWCAISPDSHAGDYEQALRAGLQAALTAGQRVLAAGERALDAVQAAVEMLEDDPLFNAGRGAVLTLDGAAELDAAIMEGTTLRAGAVALVRTAKHPIRLARCVLERLPHVFLDGDGADAYAAEAGVERVNNEYFITAERRAQLEALLQRLEEQRRLASQAAGQARQDALKSIDDTRQKLEAAQAKQQALVNTQISEVKQSTDSKLTAVNTDITGVKTDVASTKSELEKTIADLKATTGDLNVQSGLIATNGKELAALKALGERNYFEFKIGKSKEPQKVGDVLVQLKKTDPKRNKFTIELTADDKRVEKKDRTINEPLQFYVSKARQPYEIVVNQVNKNEIAGYLATPKVQQSRN